ncbi:MAG: histidine ammonia-lyase [Solirubrobacterales bacterium]|nr:histidine ammonia-lyase [Solirubrobacterales bacterium]
MIVLDGRPLDPAALAEIARRRVCVAIDPRARDRVRDAHATVLRAAADGRSIYGVTTGLGPRVVDRVDLERDAEYSARVLRARATSVGPPLSAELTRAVMAVRLNGACAGTAGVSEAVADGLAALLNAAVHPRVPRSGSVGASDLCMMAHVGLGLIGEGEAELGGETMAAGDALARAGLRPVPLGVRDGLAICSSSAVSAGVAALALLDAEAALAAAQIAAALSMEGFRANLTPLHPRVVAARPAPGQAWAAEGLRALLVGGSLTEPGAARRLQDPLSLRCVSQVHGSLRFALDGLATALAPELGGGGDNPLVLADDVVSTGNFHVPALALALDALAIALAQVAGMMAERQARLKVGRLSGLPDNLTVHGPTHAGLGTLTKTAQALSLEIAHRAAPLATLATVGADGVEDDSTGATQAALRCVEQLERVRPLVAVELIVAAQAVDEAAPERLGAGTEIAWRLVRETVAPLGDDRPFGLEIERLVATALTGGELLAAVSGALA